MIDSRCDLLSRILKDLVAELQAGVSPDQSWAAASKAIADARVEDDIELFVAVEDRDLDSLRAIVRGWGSGERVLTKHDREVLKRALKAFRKRLKIVRLDSESTVGGGPMSAGRESSIIGVAAPDQFPQEVWDELVRQNRLVEGSDGIYELPPE